jgi:hypothetical protein
MKGGKKTMAGIHKLEDIKEYFLEKFTDTLDSEFILDDGRIEKCYKYIKNKNSRVNDNDKQWIAYSSEEYERKTAIEAIKKILDDNSMRYKADTIMESITNVVDEVGGIFEENEITFKARIPFYILVLHKLLEE